MNHTAAVITVSDSCSAGTRQDTSGPRVCAMVEQAGYRSSTPQWCRTIGTGFKANWCTVRILCGPI